MEVVTLGIEMHTPMDFCTPLNERRLDSMIKLIAIDMDGTLLNSQKEIPEENIKAIQEAAAAGIKIVLCTGRPRSGILPHFEKLGLSEEEYIIMNNGCSTYDTKNWNLLQYESLSRSEMEELLQACEGFPEVALTFTGEKTYYVVGDEVPELVAYDASTVFTEAKARSLEEIFVEGQVIFQAMYMADSEPLDAFQNAVQDRLSQSYSTVRSQDYIFEIMPRGATKASGLKHLAEKLGIAPDQIMALGDAANDLEMLQFVGQSVAMGNASDDIKALCKYVTLTNDEAGVAHAIRTWAL